MEHSRMMLRQSVEVVSGPHPASSPTFLQEWSVKTLKGTNRGHFILNSELTTLNGDNTTSKKRPCGV